MSCNKMFLRVSLPEFHPTEFPFGFLGNNGSKMNRSSLIQNKKKKVFIVDINCRALICSFTEHDGSLVCDRIIADGAERGFFFGKCAVTDLCGCGWNTDDPTAFLKPPPFVPARCFICLRLPPPLRGEASPLEDGRVAA